MIGPILIREVKVGPGVAPWFVAIFALGVVVGLVIAVFISMNVLQMDVIYPAWPVTWRLL